MTAEKALAMARQLMDGYGLVEWDVQFDDSGDVILRDEDFSVIPPRYFGLCSFTRKCIFLEYELLDARWRYQVRKTILHEIAHALVGPQHGHGPVWQRKARKLGVSEADIRSHALNSLQDAI